MYTFEPVSLIESRAPLRVAEQSIHVWGFSLHGSTACIEHCRQCLAASERERAERFVFAADRDEYVVAHGVLRHLLGRYCGMDPSALQFSAAPAGKPRLESARARGPRISFNLTHSGARALLAVSDGRELGVDLERIRPDIEALAISSRFFFGPERAAIELAPPAQRAALFFRHWVAKEAVLKADGIGMGFPLDHFHVDFHPSGATAGITTHEPERLAGHWAVQMLPTEFGWTAALAAIAGTWKVRLEQPEREPPRSAVTQGEPS